MVAGSGRTVLIATQKPFAADATAKIEKILSGVEYTVEKLEGYSTSDELDEKIAAVGPDALIVRSDKITQDVMDKSPVQDDKKKLQLVVRQGQGLNLIGKFRENCENVFFHISCAKQHCNEQKIEILKFQ